MFERSSSLLDVSTKLFSHLYPAEFLNTLQKLFFYGLIFCNSLFLYNNNNIVIIA